MHWTNKNISNRLIPAAFLIILLGGAAVLTFTARDEGASIWPWTSIHSVQAADNQDSLLRQVATIDIPGPKGKRFDYLTIDPSRQLLFSTHLGAGLLYAIDLRTEKVTCAVIVHLRMRGVMTDSVLR